MISPNFEGVVQWDLSGIILSCGANRTKDMVKEQHCKECILKDAKSILKMVHLITDN